MAQVEICDGCNGKKYVDCPICDGRGIIIKNGVRVIKKGTPFVLEQTECQSCQGTGKLLCELCHGVGKILVDKPSSSGFRTLR